jgi:hypothetical protein
MTLTNSCFFIWPFGPSTVDEVSINMGMWQVLRRLVEL